MANEIIPLFEPGRRPSAAVASPVVAGKFVKVAADMQASPILNVSSPLVGGNLIQVAQTVAGDRALGVAVGDGPNAGDVVGVMGPGLIVPMVAGAAITFGQEVQSDAAGNPIPVGAGRPNGMACNSAANGGTVWVALR